MSIVTSPIDLSLLPAPDALQVVDFEEIYASRKQRLVDLFPPEVQGEVYETLALESEPMSKLLQENSYREMVIRQRVNDCVRRVLLAFAKGTDLDHLGARYYVKRLVVQAADPNASPPLPLIMEDDDAYLERIQDAYEGLSVAGPRGAYEFHTRSADGRVVDARAISPAPCDVEVYVLSFEGDGTASQELLDVVAAALNDEEIRPLGDRVMVLSSDIVPYQIKAKLHMKSAGPGRKQAVELARELTAAHAHRRKRQGWSVWLSKLDSLMHVEGVERVEIIEPAEDIELLESQAAYCTGIDIRDAEEAEE
ncbi:baseplate J/gp47 family protein [Paracandidimonas soli]|uniref:Phage-related baseplate assembly protein n=1 Tax=Paracandidimonas soli TaxID=1917182 RepID=A0A4R3VCX1_9BURK|nr:baseplate J/gp47 family protein [Paracandidimonas soli]TCV00515.1 phage-related baseplate assembly protein [Paracandidimonas soli]